MKNKIHSIGDIVIALTNPKNDKSQVRVKGNEYAVQDVMYCSKCGIQKINIGTSTVLSGKIKCNCDTVSLNLGLAWTNANLFVKREDFQEVFDEALEEENYELASILRDTNPFKILN
tara:strand:+ start:66 stop:416 length:351 start_codon:yes stop_codon:yes gene_type:complete